MPPRSAALLTLLIAPLAWAAEPPVDLVWQAPDGCPTPAEILQRIERALGSSLPPSSERMRVRAEVTSSSGRWQLRLNVSAAGSEGERVVEGDGCEQLAQVTALVVAMALDPTALAERTRVPLRPLEPAPAASSALQLTARPMVALDFGTWPSPEIGVGLAVGFVAGRARAELVATTFRPQLVRPDPALAVGARIWLPWAIGLRGCLDQPVGQLELGGCAELHAGPMEGTATGVTAPASAGALWSAAFLGAALSLRPGQRFRLSLEPQAGISLSRPEFRIDGFGRVHQPPWLVGRLLFGLEVTLP